MIDLHVLNSSRKLSGLDIKIREKFQLGLIQIQRLLDIDDVDVVIKPGKEVVVETGIGGYSPSEHFVYLTIDPNNPRLTERFHSEFIATLGHELHHCVRHRETGYGKKLGEALISEGLACCFEAELFPDRVPVYAEALTPLETREWFTRAKLELEDMNYNHAAWFYGGDGVPKYAGYTVGYNMIKRLIEELGLPASRLAGISARECLVKIRRCDF